MEEKEGQLNLWPIPDSRPRSGPRPEAKTMSPGAKAGPDTGSNLAAGLGIAAAPDLDKLRDLTLQCTGCGLRAGCRQVVFGEGNPRATLMFIGEGPGEQEDLQGRPFVGAAGQLLDKILAAIGLSRQDVYIANIVKCRPPYNRIPTDDEAEACFPHLATQLSLIRPKVIVALGATATRALLGKELRITRARGSWIEKDGIMYMPTYHPAALLRDPGKKRDVWEDMKRVRDYLVSQRLFPNPGP